jgi:hypothetical protein
VFLAHVTMVCPFVSINLITPDATVVGEFLVNPPFSTPLPDGRIGSPCDTLLNPCEQIVDTAGNVKLANPGYTELSECSPERF